MNKGGRPKDCIWQCFTEITEGYTKWRPRTRWGGGASARNRLGNAKAAKLVYCYRMLRGKDELDYWLSMNYIYVLSHNSWCWYHVHFVCGVMTFLPVFTVFCTFLPVYTVVMCETVFTWYKPNPDLSRLWAGTWASIRGSLARHGRF